MCPRTLAGLLITVQMFQSCEYSLTYFFSAAAAAQRVPEQHGDPLERIGKPFGGLINDIKRKYPHYRSDFVDAFKSFKCLVAFIFVYFAAIAPCVTYGGLLSEKTHGWLGLSESILATAIGGILFGFCSGQPLMIVGVTGPVLLFEETIFSVSSRCCRLFNN